LTAGIQAMGGSTDLGWPVAVVLAVIGSGLVLVLMRFGLLAAAVAALVGIVMSSTVGSFDLSSWYADRALVPMVLLLGLLLYGAMTALAGKSIFGDPLREGVN
jgi:hypothetical protein